MFPPLKHFRDPGQSESFKRLFHR